MIILEAKGLKKNYGGVKALKDGCLKLEKGTVCGLLGANGSGKTTLSKILDGLVSADSGDIFLYGKKVNIRSTKDSKKMGICMVHQNLSLVDQMSVWENINLGHEKKNWKVWLNNKNSIDNARKSLDVLCPGLDPFKKVGALSSADKQLVEIAKAISADPKILILDEPTSSLKFAQVDKLFILIDEMKKRGVSIIFISHRLPEVKRICDYVTVLRNGQTVGEINLREMDSDKHDDSILYLITDKKIERKSDYKKSCATEEVMLESKNLCIRGLLKNVSFKIRKGEIVGISGLQGQGQEELIFALSGFMRLDSGEIWLKDKRTNWKSTKDAVADGVVMVPGDKQKEGLFMDHSVLNNLLYPDYCKKGTRFLFSEKVAGKIAKRIIQKISLTPDDYNLQVNNLSGGNQQKVVLGKWLNQSPNLLLLCDPSKGIDIETRSELLAIFKQMACDGKAILFFSSDNEELVDIADRVLVMFEGSIVEEIPGEGLSNNRLIASSLRVNKNGKKSF